VAFFIIAISKNDHTMFNIFKSTAKKLEEAIMKLETELKNNDMRFLVDVMSSDDIYSPLLEKKRRTETSNTDGVSWYAHRRAEVLHTDHEKTQLLNLLAEPSNSSKRESIFFSLAHLCKNRTDNELFNFLMMHLQNEKDPICKRSILIGIEEMDKTNDTLNIEPIKQLSKKRSVDLKVNAILALKKTNDGEVEPLLLELFTATKDSNIKNMICSPLETVGTEACIPILEAAYKKTRDYALRDGIERVFHAIKNKSAI